jgi:hypothetical protein
LLGELDLCDVGVSEVKAQGKSVAVDDQHPLRPLLGESDLVAASLRRCEPAIEEGLGPV